MLTSMPIRWRLTLFHVLTALGIGVLLTIGLVGVFGISVTKAVELQAASRSIEAARILESTGHLSSDDLTSLSRDGVVIVALDEEGRIVAQTGSGFPDGAKVEKDLWRDVLATGEGTGGKHLGPFTSWNNSSLYLHAEPVNAPGSPVRVIEAAVSYDYVGQHQFETVTLLFAVIGLLVIILIGAGSFFLVRFSLAPVSDIARSAAEITAVDLSRRLPVRSRRDELGRLAITFNELLERLEEAFRDREEALAHQRRFVADASHELRTPLTSILGYARMLRSWGLDRPDVAREAVAAMEEKAERMESLVEGLLQLARGDEGAPLALERWDLRDIVQRAIGQMRPSADRGITVSEVIPEEPVAVVVDKSQIQGVIEIVLDNAIKFSSQDGIVSLLLGTAREQAVIQIIDQGPGISVADQERIFERFYRAETSRTTKGAGLGLAIALETLKRHEGSIDVESTPGHGATFTIRLPLREFTVPEPPVSA